MEDYLRLANTQNPITAAAFPAQFQALTLLSSIARLLVPLHLTPRAITWWFEHGASVGWLNLRTLPRAPTGSAQGLYAGWERVMSFVRLRETLGEETAFDLLDMLSTTPTSQATLLASISQRTGWNLGDLTFLLDTGDFRVTFPVSNPDQVLVRLAACCEQITRIGTSAAQLWSWTSDISADQARSIKQVVKARYTDEQWLAVAQPLRDVLREQQRTALGA